MQIIKGPVYTAPKLLLYGMSGAGKSTLAATLKNPLFLDFEGGANLIGVDRTPQYLDIDVFYTDMVELYRKGAAGKREYDTLVIDSADWMVRKIVEKAAGIDKNNLSETLNKSNGGYGNGTQVLINHIRTKLLPMLVALNTVGYGVCLIAHTERKTLMDEDGFNIDRITPKIDEKTMNVFVEWVDSVFYLRKGADGERTLQLDGDDNILAKNRQGLTGTVKVADINLNELLVPTNNKEK